MSMHNLLTEYSDVRYLLGSYKPYNKDWSNMDSHTDMHYVLRPESAVAVLAYAGFVGIALLDVVVAVASVVVADAAAVVVVVARQELDLGSIGHSYDYLQSVHNGKKLAVALGW